MALTPENIAKINELLDDHKTMAPLSFRDKYFKANTASSARALSSALISALRQLGVQTEKVQRGIRIDPDEAAEFRAWKKSRRNQDHITA